MCFYNSSGELYLLRQRRQAGQVRQSLDCCPAQRSVLISNGPSEIEYREKTGKTNLCLARMCPFCATTLGLSNLQRRFVGEWAKRLEPGTWIRAEHLFDVGSATADLVHVGLGLLRANQASQAGGILS